MNLVILHGRMVRDPEVKTTPGGKRYCRFPVAVDRLPNKDGERKADFPMCLAWERKADFLEKYFSKGQQIILSGRLLTGSYQKDDGSKVFTTDVVVDNVEFAGGSGKSSENRPARAEDHSGEDEIPF